LNGDGEYWTGTVTAFSLQGLVVGEAILVPWWDSLNFEYSNSAHYSINDLTTDPCYVLAEVDCHLPQYYDHVYTSEDATPVYPSAEDIDFDLEQGAGPAVGLGSVSGLIRGASGPLPYTSVYAKKGGNLVTGRINGSSGTYHLSGLLPGSYNVYATRAGYNTGDYLGSITVAEAEVPGINIALEPFSSIEEHEVILPDYSISSAPNPFGFATTISYALPNAGAVSVKVYDVNGSLIRTLVNGFQKAGEHQITWNGKDSNGQSLSSGIYFCRVVHGTLSASNALILVR
jgi:hypothetical protein